MGGGIVVAWGVGVGLISYHYWAQEHSPPPPGDILVGSGAFVIAAILGMADPTLGTLLAVGFDCAALLRIYQGNSPAAGLPGALNKQTQAASKRLA